MRLALLGVMMGIITSISGCAASAAAQEEYQDSLKKPPVTKTQKAADNTQAPKVDAETAADEAATNSQINAVTQQELGSEPANTPSEGSSVASKVISPLTQ